MRRGLALTLALAAPLVLGDTACRQLVGIEDRPASPSLAFSHPACEACVADRCADQEGACADDADCAVLGSCIAATAPDDPTARHACELAHGSAAKAAPYVALDACLRASCQNGCLGTRGLFVAYGAGCDECLAADEVCGDAIRRCIADGACERAYAGCFGDRASLSPASVYPCYYGGGDGIQIADEIEQCMGVCPNQCSFTHEWQCVGKWSWPFPSAARAHVNLLLRESSLTSDLPAVGPTVEVCEPAQVPCRAGQTVDPKGTSTASLDVDVPNVDRGWYGYFRLSGTSNGEPITPENYFLGRPVVTDLTEELWVTQKSFLPLAAKAFGVEAVPGLAHLAFGVLDCDSRLGVGVTIEITPARKVTGADPKRSTKIAYYPPGGTATSGLGPAFALNVSPGCVEVVGKRDGVVTHRQRVAAVANELTAAYVAPLDRAGSVAFACEP